MSCALPSPENAACANKRPVHGRAMQAAAAPAQAPLVPLAHGYEAAVPVLRPVAAGPAPFGESAPEATFSLAQVRDAATPSEPIARPMADIAQHVRATPPSFRQIRAAAATRAPIAQVRIPDADVDAAQAPLPGMDQLVERVRQRTAARLSRFSVTPA